MAQITDGAILSLAVDARLDGQQVLLTTHWKMDALSPAVSVDMEDAIDAIHTEMEVVGNLVNVLPDVYSEDVISIQYIYQWIHPTRYIRFIKTGADTEGNIASPALPPNVAHVITIRDDIAGPSHRGNKHIGGVPTTYSEAGFATPVGVAAYDILGEAMTNVVPVTLGADTWNMLPLIFHRTTPAASVQATNHITGATTRIVRRRTVGLGS